MYVKGYRSLGGGRWLKATPRGWAIGQRLGRVGPVSFGIARGGRWHGRRSRPDRTATRIIWVTLTLVAIASALLVVVA